MKCKSFLQKFTVAFLAAVISITAVFPAYAVSRYEKVEDLFIDDVLNSDRYIRYLPDEAKELYGDDVTDSDYVELDVIQRAAKKSMTIEKDTTITETFQIKIPKKCTLTIEKGVTLKIYGELVIEGTLINNGTIIVSEKAKNIAREDPDVEEFITKYIMKRQITNRGKITNNGKITIWNGAISNEIGSSFVNDGSITINNGTKDGVGFVVRARKYQGEIQGSTLENNGKITVANTNGTGLHIFGGASCKNNGEIVITGKGTVKGNVKGNSVTKGK